MKLLITGFDAFGEDIVNPSFEAVKNLPENIGDIKLIKKQLPTKYRQSIIMLDELILEHQPDFVICTGQAAGRSKISLEKVGLNLMEARIKDNEGYMPKDVKVHSTGNLAYYSNLPLKLILNNLNNQGIPSEISYSAGTFVCNSSLYHLLYLINEKSAKFKAGFVHIPLIPVQLKNREKKVFTMELSKITKALEVVISSLND